ncbi:MAG TPA: hypothetical protein VL025_07760 [Thermoanaerobaculia bacterium]|nr:hypothetical protein [Thermoanaerobaculia bacterium]
MKRKKVKKLSLNRETLRTLEDPILARIRAGLVADQVGGQDVIKISRESNCISICLGCTTPLDTCPDPTVV